MSNSKYRVLFICSQTTQNPAPLQLLAQHPKLEMLSAYCSLLDAKLWQGLEYLNKAVFDIPILEGYPWLYVPNCSPLPSLGKTFGLINPGLVNLIPKFDCCVVYGHAYVSFWLAIAATKLSGKPLLLSIVFERAIH